MASKVKKGMTVEKAYAKDKGSFMVDFDKKSGLFGVFGTESAFCYTTHSSEADAVGEMNSMGEIFELRAEGLY